MGIFIHPGVSCARRGLWHTRCSPRENATANQARTRRRQTTPYLPPQIQAHRIFPAKSSQTARQSLGNLPHLKGSRFPMELAALREGLLAAQHPAGTAKGDTWASFWEHQPERPARSGHNIPKERLMRWELVKKPYSRDNLDPSLIFCYNEVAQLP